MNMRRRFFEAARRLTIRLRPKPDQSRTVAALEGAVHTLSSELGVLRSAERTRREAYLEMVAEMAEATQMAGAGPWKISDAVITRTNELMQSAAKAFDSNTPLLVRESSPIPASQGAMGDIELALQNVEWRREINLSWYEFSRWGIQQIMLISRLYYIKNPIVRRLIDIASVYVFGRGVEVSSSDPDANDVLKEFFERNTKVLGQIALCNLERTKYYDGNLFFAFFADAQDKGLSTVRTLDGTEIQEIINDPDDADTPWYYKRQWTSRAFDADTGQTRTDQQTAWYPALGFDPKDKPEKIGGQPVMWSTPIYHRRYGAVGKWKFGCPIIYPALNWARSATRYLEACATVQQSLANFSLLLQTKGGQQALEGAKQQLETSVGPSSAIWDQNPPPVKAAVFASGPGTTLEAFKTSGAGQDPEKVRQFKLQACMVTGVPETFLGDVSTGNLATATTLDRPTELVFCEKQEDWREILVAIAKYVLSVSKGAPSGQLREAYEARRRFVEAKVLSDAKATKLTEAQRKELDAAYDLKTVVIAEGDRALSANGRMRYTREAKKPKPGKIDVMATFPAIREGDLPLMVKAIAEAMTLDNKGGQVVGIDEKIGVKLLLQELGVDQADELVEEMYPDSDYDPDRTEDPLPAPIGKILPDPGGEPQAPGGHDPQPATKQVPAAEAGAGVMQALARLREIGERLANAR